MRSGISAGSRIRRSTAILEEIARHAESHPDWLERSGV